jgi:WhiB family redox-sensing transcriptional regulator
MRHIRDRNQLEAEQCQQHQSSSLLEINSDGSMIFSDTDLELTEVERALLDIFIRSTETHTGQQLWSTMKALGIEISPQALKSQLDRLAKKCVGMDGEQLLARTGKTKAMRYGFRTGIVIDDDRIKTRTRVVYDEDKISHAEEVAETEALLRQLATFDEEVRRSPEMTALMDMVEAYIMEGVETDDGRPTGYYEPLLKPVRERVAVMQVFRRLDLPLNEASMLAAPAPKGLSEEEKQAREARILRVTRQMRRRDALAKRLYGHAGDKQTQTKIEAKALFGIRPQLSGEANCQGVDPEFFFPERGESTKEAKAVCRACDVQEECLEYSLANKERFGIWGGLSERERRRLRRRRSLVAAASTPHDD